MSATDPTTSALLKALLTGRDGYVSEEELARKTGASQGTIRGHLEPLRSEGFRFERVAACGYRLTQKPKFLNPWATAAFLVGQGEIPELIFLSSIDSSNDHAARLLAHNYDAPFFVVTNEQTKGRGRMGRKWHSPPSRNLYLSFASRPRVNHDRIRLFTLWMGARIARDLGQWLGVRIRLKWPNDLYYEGKKLGGMLTETRGDADTVRQLVFGVGLNVNQRREDWPADLGNSATSLREITGHSLDLNRANARLIKSVWSAYGPFATGSVRRPFEDLWPGLDALRGKSIRAEMGGVVYSGIASGLDDGGSLIVKTGSGKLVTLNAGNVHITTTD